MVINIQPKELDSENWWIHADNIIEDVSEEYNIKVWNTLDNSNSEIVCPACGDNLTYIGEFCDECKYWIVPLKVDNVKSEKTVKNVGQIKDDNIPAEKTDKQKNIILTIKHNEWKPNEEKLELVEFFKGDIKKPPFIVFYREKDKETYRIEFIKLFKKDNWKVDRDKLNIFVNRKVWNEYENYYLGARDLFWQLKNITIGFLNALIEDNKL